MADGVRVDCSRPKTADEQWRMNVAAAHTLEQAEAEFAACGVDLAAVLKRLIARVSEQGERQWPKG